METFYNEVAKSKRKFWEKQEENEDYIGSFSFDDIDERGSSS